MKGNHRDELDFTERATILVIDDMPGNLTLMSSLLKDDYKVKVANGGEKALKIAASDSPPSLILLDVMMPGMDGYSQLAIFFEGRLDQELRL